MNANDLVDMLLEEVTVVAGRTSKTTNRYLALLRNLPLQARAQAMEAYLQWIADPQHPGLHFKRLQDVGDWWAIRVGGNYRAICYATDTEWMWHWIGTHEEYNKLVGSKKLIKNWSTPSLPP